MPALIASMLSLGLRLHNKGNYVSFIHDDKSNEYSRQRICLNLSRGTSRWWSSELTRGRQPTNAKVGHKRSLDYRLLL